MIVALWPLGGRDRRASPCQRTHTLVRNPTVHFSKIRPFGGVPVRLAPVGNSRQTVGASLGLPVGGSQASGAKGFCGLGRKPSWALGLPASASFGRWMRGGPPTSRKLEKLALGQFTPGFGRGGRPRRKGRESGSIRPGNARPPPPLPGCRTRPGRGSGPVLSGI
jgi:hypothetical protein